MGVLASPGASVEARVRICPKQRGNTPTNAALAPRGVMFGIKRSPPPSYGGVANPSETIHNQSTRRFKPPEQLHIPMKKIPTICALALSSATASHAALIAQYDFTAGSVSSSAVTTLGTAGDVTFPPRDVSDGGDPPVITTVQFTAANDQAEGTNIPTADFFVALQFTFTVGGLAADELFQIDSFGAELTATPGGPGRRFNFLMSEDGGATFATFGNQGARRGTGVFLEETVPASLTNSYSNGDLLTFQLVVRDSNANNSDYGIDNINLSGSVIPEPSSAMLLGSLGALALLRRRK